MFDLRDLNRNDPKQIRKLVEYRKSLDDPYLFASMAFGDELWDEQTYTLRALRKHKKVTVRSCHGIGKTHLGSRAALDFINHHKDCIVVTTAPTWRQVEEQMWRYMNSAYTKSLQRLPLAGRMLTTKYNLSDDWYAIGVSSNDTDKIQGFHAASGYILVIVDEAAGVDEPTFTAIEAIMISENAHLLLLGNPTSVAGSFRNSHTSDTSFHKIHVSCFDTPNFINNGIETLQDLIECDLDKVENTHPYLITPAWAKDKITRWGIESPDFQSRVLGEFPSAEANTIIPVNLIEAATTPERLAKLTLDGHLDQPHRVGNDVARYGDDETTIYGGHGGILQSEQIYKRQSTAITADKLAEMPPSIIYAIDIDGVGGGVLDSAEKLDLQNLYGIHNNASPVQDATGIKFANLKSQLWYYASQQFKLGTVYIPPEMDILCSQLASIRFKQTTRGWTVEGKDETKKRLRKSPDRAEGYIYWLGSQLLETAAVGGAGRAGMAKRRRDPYNKR